MRIASRYALAVVWLCLSCGDVRATDGPSAEVIEVSARSVVQVIARQCGGPDRTGSGFVWLSSSTVVTANHVVAGCTNVRAFVQGSGEIGASVEHVLTGVDLAMLRLDAPAAPPLRAATAAPQVDDTLQAIGYYFGVATRSNVALRVALGSSQLRDMLPDALRQELVRSRAIDIGTEVLRLGGSLEPGLSGAPLIDARGEVAGIGSGGLESGFVAISWAVRAQYLSQLPTAPQADAERGRIVSGLFEAPIEGTRPDMIRLGQYRFQQSRVRTLQEVMPTADDLRGLFQLATASGFDVERLTQIPYKVYVEPESGAAVAIPAELSLRTQGNELVAGTRDGLSIRVTAVPVSNPYEIQAAALQFEQTFDPHGLFWVPNPAFSYLTPLQRPDGLITNRKSGMGGDGLSVRGLTFETLMARSPLFVGIQITNIGVDQATWNRCQLLAQDDPSCRSVHRNYDIWAAAVLGAHLSTFPPR